MSLYPAQRTDELTEAEQAAVLHRFDHLVASTNAPHSQQLEEIRESLEDQLGTPVQLGDALVRGAWDPDASQWDRFCYWAGIFLNRSDYNADEIDFKIEIANLMAEAKDSVLAGDPDWQEKIKRPFSTGNQLVGWRISRSFLDWCRDSPEAAAGALEALWTGTEDVRHRLTRFLERLPRDVLSGPSARLGIASQLLLGEDVYRYPFFKATAVGKAFELTGNQFPTDRNEIEKYLETMELMERICHEAQKRGVEVNDALNAQSIAWSLALWHRDDFHEREQVELQRFRDGLPPGAETSPSNGLDPAPVTAATTINDLATDLLIDQDSLRDINDLLNHRRQAIFYGPPGTGKTYIALKLAEYLAGSKERVDLVQFHAAYAYEDFVEGFRPREINGAPGFQLEGGPLKRIAKQAHDNPGETHVLIIDEINRANIARVFGELYFLLEYRDRDVSLQYSAEPFRLPSNLLIIGTMNTADRSIALLDAALRRRFYFIPFFPMEPPIEGLLQRWLNRNNPDMHWVADVVDRANELLDDRDGGIGPSYFMRQDLNERWVRLIWEHQILPYLEEHFFGAPDRLEDFQLDALRSGGNVPTSTEMQDDDTDSTDAE